MESLETVSDLTSAGEDVVPRTHTLDTLYRDLKTLGVEQGDTLFVHSSFKSLGEVEGGAHTVVSALENAADPGGLILMPSFNLLEDNRLRAETWNPDTTPSTVGWLTEFFRTLPGTYRSDHYSHSVAARGRNAGAFVGGHRDRNGRSSPWDRDPWGKTYGDNSPMVRAYAAGGKVLMLGVTYETSTYIHLVEVICWHRRRENEPDAEYMWIDRTNLGAFWEANGRIRRGPVGDSDSRLFPIRTYVDTLVEEAECRPEAYFKQAVARQATRQLNHGNPIPGRTPDRTRRRQDPEGG